ncbi:glycerate kinase [Patescibacteria group bacterium]
MEIKNYKKIATSELRKAALEMIKVGIEEVHPKKLLEAAVNYQSSTNSVIIQNKTFDLLSGRIFVVGGGKGAGYMAEMLEERLGPEKITAGVINCISDKYDLKKIKVNKASHPIPDKRGVKGVEEMYRLKEDYKISEKDLVIALISGGGSALMPLPIIEIELEDKRATTQLLLECGASIHEINTVRKHLSQVKGGRLGEYFFPARVAAIIISDVVGHDLNVIASGPNFPDSTTFFDSRAVLLKYNLIDKIPVRVQDYIERGCQGEKEETPKTLKRSDNFIIGKNTIALEAIALEAKKGGLRPIIETSSLTGDPSRALNEITQNLFSNKYSNKDVVIFGGELNPALPKEHGKGGRNQHFVAANMLALENYEKEWVMISMGTDGADYLPKTAGAIIDNNSIQIARENNISVEQYLKSFDTYNLFKKLGNAHIVTGDTGTNVGDLIVYVIK